MEPTETWWRGAIVEWAGRDPEDLELRVAVGTLMSALTAAAAEWTEKDGDADLGELVGRALDTSRRARRSGCSSGLRLAPRRPDRAVLTP